MHKTDNLTTFMCRLSWNLGDSTSWNPQGLSRPVMGLNYLLSLPTYAQFHYYVFHCTTEHLLVLLKICRSLTMHRMNSTKICRWTSFRTYTVVFRVIRCAGINAVRSPNMLQVIKVLFIHQLMHQWVVLKTILKFTLKQLWHVSVQLHIHQGAH